MTVARLNKIPRTWKELVKLKNLLSYCDGKYLRLPEDQRFYELYLKLVPKDISLEIIKKQMDSRPVKLVKNNFPYTRALKYSPDVKHYCLWSLKGKLSEKDIEKYVLKAVKNRSWFYTERRPGHKTIPEVWHCHVFVKED